MADDPGSIRFLPDGVDVPWIPGESLLSHALHAGVPLLSPCGGENRCGKCRVAVTGKTRGGDDPGILTRAEIAAGIRLACRCFPVCGDVSVTILPGSRPARLAAFLDGKDLAGEEPFLPLSRAATGGVPLGVALDLGTSTLAGTLVNLSDGTVLSRATADNPQMGCGEDLISRIVFVEEATGGFELLRGRLLSGVDGLVRRLLETSRVQGEVTDVVAAGNTVISHFLYGISPAPIRRPPYHPVRKEYPVVPGETLGTGPETHGRCGGSSRPSGGSSEATSLQAFSPRGCIGRRRSAFSSTSARTGRWCWGTGIGESPAPPPPGPLSREAKSAAACARTPGRSSRSGSNRGTRAAEWTVIGRGRPAGLCGSGILDLCAELFRAGIVDRSGRFTSRGGGGRRSTDRGEAFVVVPADKSATGRDVSFCESDLKSVVRTKAALCAAAEALLAAVGIQREAVAHVYVAGGFGNFLDLRSALTIGLFPPIRLARFAPLGNASLAGALGALRNRRRWKEALSLASGTLYHDLSSDPGFMELYQRGLFLPHTDEERYRSVLAAETGA